MPTEEQRKLQDMLNSVSAAAKSGKLLKQKRDEEAEIEESETVQPIPLPTLQEALRGRSPTGGKSE